MKRALLLFALLVSCTENKEHEKWYKVELTFADVRGIDTVLIKTRVRPHYWFYHTYKQAVPTLYTGTMYSGSYLNVVNHRVIQEYPTGYDPENDVWDEK